MGLLSRNKGKVFERAIATSLREHFPDKVIRRSTQADAAWEPDVVVEGTQLWIECQHAVAATPLKKLEQAEADARRAAEHTPGRWVVPICIAVWRRGGTSKVQATLRLHALQTLVDGGLHEWEFPAAATLAVTLDWADLLPHL